MTELPRKFLAIVSVVAVQCAALTAPFIHVHLENHVTGHHAGPAMHAHLSEHTGHHALHHDGLEVEGPDDDRAIYPQIFVAVGAASFDPPALVAESVVLPFPSERPAIRPLTVFHGHDPPGHTRLSPRAPPAFLS
jgi:hypothetical protein